MVQKYNILGTSVSSHVLAMVTLGSTFGASYLLTRGSSDPQKLQQANLPPIKAGDPDEESFIKEFLAKAEEESKSKHDAKH